MLFTILIVILAVVFLAAVPAWHHSKSWGYYPCIGVAMALAAVINLASKGHL